MQTVSESTYHIDVTIFVAGSFPSEILREGPSEETVTGVRIGCCVAYAVIVLGMLIKLHSIILSWTLKKGFGT